MDEPIEVNVSPPSGPHILLEVAFRNKTHTPAASGWQMSYEASRALDSAVASQLSGNSANAEVVVKDRVSMAEELRWKHFTFGANYLRYLGDGLVGSDQVNKRSPLKPGSWAFVFSDMFVYVCEALAFYSKEAGDGARHAWRESTTSISAVSYVIVQAYEATGASRNQFRSLLNSQVKTHADLPTPNVLGGKLTLSDSDWLVFQKLAETTLLREALLKAILGLSVVAQKKGIVE